MQYLEQQVSMTIEAVITFWPLRECTWCKLPSVYASQKRWQEVSKTESGSMLYMCASEKVLELRERDLWLVNECPKIAWVFIFQIISTLHHDTLSHFHKFPLKIKGFYKIFTSRKIYRIKFYENFKLHLSISYSNISLD